jgi:broad specificity phosphatase PhoE/predicted ATPase
VAWDRSTEQALPSHEVTHLHLLRHGAVDTGGQRRCYGHTDYPPSALGAAQADALVAACRDHLPRPDGVLGSDLLRCRALAEPLAAALGVPLELDARLREQHMGDWEGRTWADLTDADLPGVRAYWTDYATARPPGGETFGEMAARLDAFFEARWDRLRGRRWMVVGHGGPIRALSASLLGLPIDQALRFSALPGTHTWFQIAQAGAVLQVLGERPAVQSAGSAGESRRVEPVSPRPRRVALSGSAGTGKTTLARRLAARWGLPYIPEGMRARIEAGLDLHTLDHDGMRALIGELWAEQVEREDRAVAAAGGFVADRSPLDFLAFWLLYGFAYDLAGTDALAASVRARAAALDRVFVLPADVLPLQADGVRTPNPWVQRRFQATVEGLLAQELRPEQLARMPGLDQLDARVRWVEDVLSGGGLFGG